MNVAKSITPSSNYLLICDREMIETRTIKRPMIQLTTVKPILVFAYALKRAFFA
jgi:hypothetical protein